MPEQPMVTDKLAAEWRKFAEAVAAAAPAPQHHSVIPEPEQCVLALTRDRNRWIALAELVVRNWDYGPIGKAPSDEARKLLGEAHDA